MLELNGVNLASRPPRPARTAAARTKALRSLVLAGAGLFAAALSMAAPAVAQPFEGCPSKEILARFEEFGRTGKMPPDLGAWLGNPKAQYIEPWKVFDNVHYVGVCWVSSWVIRTSDGIVLIDTLHEPHVDQLIANLRKVGVDFADIKYVLMTHGHFDHVGGAVKLKPLLPNAKFVMTQTGWDEAAQSAKQSEATPRRWSMIEQGVVVKDGDTIKLGDNTFGVLETPGHTHGTASYIYDVKDGAKTYRAITVGGLGLNAIENSKQVEGFIASLDKIERLVKQPNNPVTVHLTTHPFSNGLTEIREKVITRNSSEPNPLVDPQGLLAQLASLRRGAEERLEIERKAGR
ncbi:MBL fold metallo-hydrolase [Bradyrhizobium sp.]|jgi:metallo-beta-lactamase class B|uniref:MBL fold metallo-hydrolase n=1 Tax=Bradyrhizobium sp. TaxID=376 RepID=UPI0025BF3D80|nr:MBL fold metallo-hydrolase [Bradyrhizobium sp.]